MQRSVPEHAPLLAGNVVCHTCGSILKPEVVKGRSGVSAIRYSCYNKDSGCSYFTETNQYLSSEVLPSRPKEHQV
jgi:hypothetical protein